MSHHGLWSEGAGSADTLALHACVPVSLTHGFYIELWNLQNQTQLLAEQQLHDCADSEAAKTLHEFMITATQFVSCMCELRGHQTKRCISLLTSSSLWWQLNINPTVSCERHLQQAGNEASIADVMSCTQQTIWKNIKKIPVSSHQYSTVFNYIILLIIIISYVLIINLQKALKLHLKQLKKRKKVGVLFQIHFIITQQVTE